MRGSVQYSANRHFCENLVTCIYIIHYFTPCKKKNHTWIQSFSSLCTITWARFCLKNKQRLLGGKIVLSHTFQNYHMEADDMMYEHGSIYKVNDFDLVKYMANEKSQYFTFCQVYLEISNKQKYNDNLIFYENSTILTNILKENSRRFL